MTGDPPLAVRATAYPTTTRWLRRRVRAFRYDVWWRGGRVDHDVRLVDVLYRRAPADYAVVRDAVHEACPEVGTGPWIEYPTGFVVDGPDGEADGPTWESRPQPLACAAAAATCSSVGRWPV